MLPRACHTGILPVNSSEKLLILICMIAAHLDKLCEQHVLQVDLSHSTVL